MVRFLSITSSPLVKVIVPVTEKLIVSPGAASRIACLRDPGSLSVVFVTVIVLPTAARLNISRPATPKKITARNH